ncbi:sensor histidine kinase [Actinokineospora terrae]|uniref:Histidine kinase-like ATPase domain-containing protein n=1 Tax=Actinokineospora terrae TaxID=155974 RepID=A0A1H9LI47_9PSEU|nr:sensor histidine kinase [Actinokineospora terrae]SER11096.1 Histidine kinase-like ATPase domain-containing protein [Actinokineospora terrae]
MSADSAPGYVHTALCYASDRELLDSAVPFLAEGVERGDAVVIALDPARADLVLAELDRPDAVTTLPAGGQYARPALSIKSYCDLFTTLLDGVGAVRVLGALPPAAMEQEWDVWSRYEAAVNRAFDRFPVSTMCTYDTRELAPEVVADVLSTHPLLADPRGDHPRNPAFVDPSSFLRRPQRAEPLPVQFTAPAVDLVDPMPATARAALHAVRTVAPAALDDLVVSVSEVVTNAHTHGTAPIHLRAWTEPAHMVVTVHDAGPGPTDPFAGLIPTPSPRGGGYGLWIAHQLCTHVLHTHDTTGFTVRLSIIG